MNLETDSYNCWTCSDPPTRGRTLTGLLRKRVPEEMLREYLDSLADSRPTRRTMIVQTDEDPPKLPSEFESLTWDYGDDPTARRYLNYVRRRGATDADIRFFRMGMCRTGPLANRVVFPSFDRDGDLNFYTARKISDDVWGQSYMTPGTTKDIIFNDCLVDWSYPIVIVEGPFDMLTAGRNSIPLQGKMLRTGSRLFERIVTTVCPVYIALDADALYDQVAMAHMLHRYGVTSYLVELEGRKDVSELGRERFGRCLLDATQYRDTDRIRFLCA